MAGLGVTARTPAAWPSGLVVLAVAARLLVPRARRCQRRQCVVGCAARRSAWRRCGSGSCVWRLLPGWTWRFRTGSVVRGGSVGRRGDREHRGDVPVRCGRVARRGDAGASGRSPRAVGGCSPRDGRRLAADWPRRQSPLTRTGLIGDPRQGACPTTVSGRPSSGEENFRCRWTSTSAASARRRWIVPLSADLPGAG